MVAKNYNTTTMNNSRGNQQIWHRQWKGLVVYSLGKGRLVKECVKNDSESALGM